MLLASLLFTSMNVLVKLVAEIPAIEVIFFRSLVSLVLSYAILSRQGVSPLGHRKGLLIGRGLAGAAALIMFFTTLQNIPLAGAVTLHFLSPIFTTLLGIFVVKEKVKPLQWVFFGLAFAGILIIEGFDARITPLYLGLGIGAAFFAGIAYNIIRKLNVSEHPLVIVFYFPLVTLPIVSIYLLAGNWVQPEGIEWVYLLAIGLLTQQAQYHMTRAYQSEELNKVASVNYVSIIYALSFGYIFFGETFELMTYLGMGLVLCGIILNLFYKNRLKKKEALQTQKS